ncbi:hypothetical protein ZWY2020_001049 [Hordeum vulgare]|nr:hypothetical protein ZWY2020_001049 [Hordeum vulgare]
MFLVSGQSFAAHKLILAARSPVFMAEFFGNMKEKSSQSVEIEDMEGEVFKALLQFIYTDAVPEFRQQAEVDADAVYTDSVPEFEQQEDVDAEAATVMAQHLLAAADSCAVAEAAAAVLLRPPPSCDVTGEAPATCSTRGVASFRAARGKKDCVEEDVSAQREVK